MNLDKIREINEELEKRPTITEKLNYWKTNYLDIYPTSESLHKYFESKSKEELGSYISDGLRGELRLPVTQYMLIPSLDSPNYGVPLEIRIEYYHWMIKFLAERLFKEHYQPVLLKELEKPLGKEVIKGELAKIDKIQKIALTMLQKGEIALYNTVDKLTPEKLYLWYANDFYSRIEIRVEDKKNIYVISFCKHHFVYPFLKELLNPNFKESNQKILKMTGINYQRLISELLKRKYFDKENEKKVENWFKGIANKEPVTFNKPMNHFASVIASLQEGNYIKNTKVFCCDLIQKSFLFHNQQISLSSIKNSMKKNDSTRIKSVDKENYIDIQIFAEK